MPAVECNSQRGVNGSDGHQAYSAAPVAAEVTAACLALLVHRLHITNSQVKHQLLWTTCHVGSISLCDQDQAAPLLFF